MKAGVKAVGSRTGRKVIRAAGKGLAEGGLNVAANIIRGGEKGNVKKGAKSDLNKAKQRIFKAIASRNNVPPAKKRGGGKRSKKAGRKPPYRTKLSSW
jgi:hypothetical protein